MNYKALFNASPNAYVVFSTDFTLLDANAMYFRITGRKREDIIGSSVFDAFPANPADPEGRNVMHLRASLERVLATKMPDTLALIHYAIPRQTDDGLVFDDKYWSATHTPLLDDDGEVGCILQHTVDVTSIQQLKRDLSIAEVALDSISEANIMEQTVWGRAQQVQELNATLDFERRRLRRLFDNAPSFIAVLSGPQHVFELTNPPYAQLVGHRDLIGKPVAEALPEVVGQGFVDLLDSVYDNGEEFIGRSVPVVLRREIDSDPEERFVDFVYQPIREKDGSTSGIFVHGHDVTIQVRAQETMRDLNDNLEIRIQERTAQLEARNRELQEFAFIASHDLQEPLRKISLFAERLIHHLGNDVDDSAVGYLERMQGATTRVSSLIRDLLSYSRVSMQGREYEKVDLNRVAQEALQDVSVLMEESQGEVILDNLPSITGDPIMMRQLFFNLIANALKFRRDGAHPIVQIYGRESDDLLRPSCQIVVSDNGIGFEPDHADRIFAPFQRLHVNGEYEGTGIGLSICRRIVEQHGGQILAEGKPGEGATFTLTLPL